MKRVSNLIPLLLAISFSASAAPMDAAGSGAYEYISAGAMLDGELQTGMNASPFAPTAGVFTFKLNPKVHTSLVGNLLECSAVVFGRARLGIERVEFELGSITCVGSKDGELYGGRGNGFVVDESNMSGLAGKIVSKSGSVLASAARHSLSSKDSEAQEKLYSDLSREIFPVIELDSGVKAKLVLSNFLKLEKVVK